MLIQHALGPGINPQSFTIWAWWCTPVILESERLRQEDQEFKGLSRGSQTCLLPSTGSVNTLCPLSRND